MSRVGTVPIRVLVVDGARSERDRLLALLVMAGGFDVIGTAGNGKDAVAATLRMRPHVVIMNINLPLLEGLAATQEIMQQCPTPVVLLSDLPNIEPHREKALAAGAVAVAPKPPRDRRDMEAEAAFCTTIRTMSQVRVVTRYAPRTLDLSTKQLGTLAYQTSGVHSAPHILALAASTGGPAALQLVLRALGPQFPLPILLVQHIARGFTSALVEWLASTVPQKVQIVEHITPLLPNHVYLAPDEHHLVVRTRDNVTITPGSAADHYCPSADVLFESVAFVYGKHALGVIMTGMGDDGARGLLALRNTGAWTAAQDQASCVVYGMPRAAIEAQAVVQITPLAQLADAISHQLRLATITR